MSSVEVQSLVQIEAGSKLGIANKGLFGCVRFGFDDLGQSRGVLLVAEINGWVR